jgi:hypothetical protein
MNHLASPPVTPSPASSRDSSIGGLLLESGKITPENAERVLRTQKELGIRFGEAAHRLGLITDEDIQQVLARQFDYPYLQARAGQFFDRPDCRLPAVRPAGGNPACHPQPADAALVRQWPQVAGHRQHQSGRRRQRCLPPTWRWCSPSWVSRRC